MPTVKPVVSDTLEAVITTKEQPVNHKDYGFLQCPHCAGPVWFRNLGVIASYTRSPLKRFKERLWPTS